MRLTEIKERARVGCTEAERAYPQTLTFNVELLLRPNDSVHTDDIAATVDYMAVAGCLRAVCEEGEWKLLEKLCFDLATELKKISPLVAATTVSARKNILPNGDGVTVEVSLD